MTKNFWSKKKFLLHPPKINIEPENDGLEDDFPLQLGVFSGSMMFHVNLPGCTARFVFKSSCSQKVTPPGKGIGISSKKRKANFTSCCVKGRRKSPEVAEVLANVSRDARWAPTSYKWSYNPYKWPYNWVTGVTTLVIGVITQVITGRGPILWSKRRSCLCSFC